MSERISWTTCPHCGGAAAVGWLQDIPIEFDCKAGCTMPDLQLLRWGQCPDNLISGSEEPVRPLAVATA